jgi:hypothetical protein
LKYEPAVSVTDAWYSLGGVFFAFGEYASNVSPADSTERESVALAA